ncbi:MAG: hypothetical protein LC679_07575 [Intrasporangiaceae bacterium]|nr:hypothetical protein [Intrasporangiaceae bacterium]
MTFAQDIEDRALLPIEAVVIGQFGWGGYDEDDRSRAADACKGEVLTWDEARPLLDYKYDDGYGSPECHAVWVWTAVEVIWVTQYDGLTCLDGAPRNPSPGVPEMPGG